MADDELTVRRTDDGLHISGGALSADDLLVLTAKGKVEFDGDVPDARIVAVIAKMADQESRARAEESGATRPGAYRVASGGAPETDPDDR